MKLESRPSQRNSLSLSHLAPGSTQQRYISLVEAVLRFQNLQDFFSFSSKQR